MNRRSLLIAAWTLAAVAAGAVAGARPQTAPKPAPVEPPTYRLRGRLELTQGGQPATDRTLDRSHAAVWFEPAGAAKPAPVRAVMSTARKQFNPQVLVVPVGSSVRFPNLDPILHNVFSVSGRNTFDLGLVGKGEGKSATFTEAGVVRVFCNVHHAMFAHVVVAASAHYATPDAAGVFVLDGLPAGRGRLRYWHERGEAGAVDVTLPRAAEMRVAVEVTQPRVPAHRNKFGKSYSRGAYE